MLEINNQTKQKINLKKTIRLAEDFGRLYKRVFGEGSGFVSLALVGGARMKRLNGEYRGADKATDVLSFGNELSGNKLTAQNDKAIKRKKALLQRNASSLAINRVGNFFMDNYQGEIIINLEEVRKVNKYRAMLEEIGLDFKTYGAKPGPGRGDNYIFYFLLVHGLLHLIGYDDKTEKGRLEMMRRGRDFLEKML